MYLLCFYKYSQYSLYLVLYHTLQVKSQQIKLTGEPKKLILFQVALHVNANLLIGKNYDV